MTQKFAIIELSHGLRTHFRVVVRETMEIIYERINADAKEVCAEVKLALEAYENIRNVNRKIKTK